MAVRTYPLRFNVHLAPKAPAKHGVAKTPGATKAKQRASLWRRALAALTATPDRTPLGTAYAVAFATRPVPRVA